MPVTHEVTPRMLACFRNRAERDSRKQNGNLRSVTRLRDFVSRRNHSGGSTFRPPARCNRRTRPGRSFNRPASSGHPRRSRTSPGHSATPPAAAPSPRCWTRTLQPAPARRPHPQRNPPPTGRHARHPPTRKRVIPAGSAQPAAPTEASRTSRIRQQISRTSRRR